MPFPGFLRTLDPPRPPTAREREILEFLLKRPILGRDDLRRQLDYVRVVGESGLGAPLLLCVEHYPGDPARLELSVPVEIEYVDSGGVTAHILVHTRDGFLSELEFFRRGSRPLSLPDSRNLPIFSTPTVLRLVE